MTYRRAIPVVGALLILATSGCSTDDEPKEQPRPSPSPSHSQPAGAIADLSQVSCKPNAHGRWDASGTLTNATSEERTYEVTFAVIKPKTSEVLGKVVRRVAVPAGASREITLTKIHRGAVKAGRCVPTVTVR